MKSRILPFNGGRHQLNPMHGFLFPETVTYGSDSGLLETRQLVCQHLCQTRLEKSAELAIQRQKLTVIERPVN
jgi:hypothetical protein